ncbi:chitinase-3-like protein 1 [Cheilinus undulatus]|uniref:chitinase-3-like protein 1 n=1 Tax=Cheilinus undulatus TaxID=241271 RepID=UPI001BD5F3AA|nr:chitinase-3-like protein 1 [Cheilinus undulatus]
MTRAQSADMNTAAVIVSLQLFIQTAAATYSLVCYFSNMSRYRTGVGKYLPDNVDPVLCTHLVYSYAIIDHENKLAESEWNEKNVYRSFTRLKQRNSLLKTLLSVRVNEDRARFSIMASSAERRQRFVRSSVTFLRTHWFDGLDLDVDQSGSDGGSSDDVQRLVLLCKELSEAFRTESDGDGRLVLSAAASPSSPVNDRHNDLAEISQFLDFISVKTFDFVSGEDAVTAHHSPLYSHNASSIDGVVTSWLQRGVPAEKLLLGFPAHARSFTLSSTADGIGAPVSGPASPGPYTQQSGVWAYYETCSFLRGTSARWLDTQKVPFAVKGSQWVGFDNQRSYSTKVDYLRSRRLGGAAVWTLDMDDFSGEFCGEGRYPLISRLKSELRDELTTKETPLSSPPSPSVSSSTGGTPPSLTPLPSHTGCLLNITLELPISRFCTRRADGLYRSWARADTIFRCVRRKTYVTRCHGEETQQGSSTEAATASPTVVTVSLTLSHVLGVWTIS